MTAKLLKLINEKFQVKEIDCGDFSSMKLSGMTFTISAYKAEGLGHVSVMTATGFFGMMKMDTLIINPTELDMPLYSYDRIFAMGNDTLIVELYNTLIGSYSEEIMQSIKAEYSDLAERDPGEHWYDSIKLASSISKKSKAKHTERLDELAFRHFEAYISSSTAPASAEQKKIKTSEYVEGLLEKGGPSTDVFKKSIGENKTAELFRTVLFGTN